MPEWKIAGCVFAKGQNFVAGQEHQLAQHLSDKEVARLLELGVLEGEPPVEEEPVEEEPPEEEPEEKPAPKATKKKAPAKKKAEPKSDTPWEAKD